MLCRSPNLGFTAIVHVSQRLTVERPFERFETGCGFASLENHVEQWAILKESQEGRIAIVPIEFLEISSEGFTEQGFQGVLTRLLAIESIVSKNIAWMDLSFETELYVVA